MMNKYFTTNDEFINRLDDFILPPEWWSRPFEYNWCSNFLEKDDIILDAACGIEHPFKFYAANRCKKVYAIDIDKDIEGITNVHNNLILSNQDISKTNFEIRYVVMIAKTPINIFKNLANKAEYPNTK